ncbi:MAG: hypothetical protein ACI9AQ_000726, partial [Dinoroseobacter sp.]
MVERLSCKEICQCERRKCKVIVVQVQQALDSLRIQHAQIRPYRQPNPRAQAGAEPA